MAGRAVGRQHPGQGRQRLDFAELEPCPCRWLHVVCTLKDNGDRVAVSFGPEFAALEQRQVELVIQEAMTLKPSPKWLVFAAFSYDPEAAKDGWNRLARNPRDGKANRPFLPPWRLSYSRAEQPHLDAAGRFGYAGEERHTPAQLVKSPLEGHGSTVQTPRDEIETHDGLPSIIEAMSPLRKVFQEMGPVQVEW
jgi:hypothetical protein